MKKLVLAFILTGVCGFLFGVLVGAIDSLAFWYGYAVGALGF